MSALFKHSTWWVKIEEEKDINFDLYSQTLHRSRAIDDMHRGIFNSTFRFCCPSAREELLKRNGNQTNKTIKISMDNSNMLRGWTKGFGDMLSVHKHAGKTLLTNTSTLWALHIISYNLFYSILFEQFFQFVKFQWKLKIIVRLSDLDNHPSFLKIPTKLLKIHIIRCINEMWLEKMVIIINGKSILTFISKISFFLVHSK